MNTFGNKFRVEIFGESHGAYVGVIIDGVPSGIALNESDFERDIDRRRPGENTAANRKGSIDGSDADQRHEQNQGFGAGQNLNTDQTRSSAQSFDAAIGQGYVSAPSNLPSGTTRAEEDIPHIVSGVFNGFTTGAPITILFNNGDARSEDYEQFRATPRPGHADFSAAERFDSFNDPRGGGHFSGRLTLPVVATGVIAKKLLGELFSEEEFGLKAQLVQVGGCTDPTKWESLLEQARKEGDSLGGVVECTAKIPAGFGDPFWNSIESLISHAVFAIPGVRGIEFGDGFAAASMRGSEHNDPFGPDGIPAKNGSGGVNGGITNGAPVVFRVAFKPTSSIAKAQTTLNFETGEMVTLKCGGRHDICFALRTPVIVEAMTAIALADSVLG